MKLKSSWFTIIIATGIVLAFNLPKIISQPVDDTAVKKPAMIRILSYQNTDDGYAFTYPSSWFRQKGAGYPVSVLFITSAEFSETPASLSVLKIKLDEPPMSLDAFSDATLRQLKQDSKKLKFITSEPTQWAGQTGYRVVLTSTTADNHPLQTAQVWTIHGDSVYLISFSGSPESYAKYQAAAEKTMISFQFLN